CDLRLPRPSPFVVRRLRCRPGPAFCARPHQGVPRRANGPISRVRGCRTSGGTSGPHLATGPEGSILSDVNVEDCARELLLARAQGALISPPSERSAAFSVEDGYAVGQLLHQKALMSGWSMAGLKLGFTNAAAWSRLGLDSPFWAPFYDRTVIDRDEISLA